MPRPERLVVVTGSGTEIGKTWATLEITRRLRADGLSVAARKPAQSFSPEDADTDASLLGAATATNPGMVCPAHRWYPMPLAPPMAADALGRPVIALDDLVAEIQWPDSVDVGFLEGAGGLCSPIAHDGDSLALIDRVQPDLVLFLAQPSLGVVSATRLASRALGATPLLVLLNRYDAADEVHRRSRDWLTSVDSLAVVTSTTAAAAAIRASNRRAPGEGVGCPL